MSGLATKRVGPVTVENFADSANIPSVTPADEAAERIRAMMGRPAA